MSKGMIYGGMKRNGKPVTASTFRKTTAEDVEKNVEKILNEFRAGGIPINRTALKIAGKYATMDMLREIRAEQEERQVQQVKQHASERRKTADSGAGGGGGGDTSSASKAQRSRRKRQSTGGSNGRRSSTSFDELNK